MTTSPDITPKSPAPAPADGGYASRALKGSVWMIFNTIATRIGSFVAQIFLAWWLTRHDFGLSGVAIGLSGFASFLRDGGVRQIILKHHDEHDTLLGPCFWMAAAFNVAMALALTAVAWPAAALYNEPSLALMLVIIAWSIPIGTPGGILMTKMVADMRFRENAAIMTTSAMTRYASSIVFALLGLGAFSFILPNVLCSLVEDVLALRNSTERPWRKSPNVAIWWSLFSRSRWALVAIVGISGMNQGPSPAIGLAAPLEVVGIYTFTFLIVVQVGSLLSTNINQVLVPVFTRLAGEAERKRAAVLRTVRQVSLFATFLSLGLAATYRPFESLIWGPKWAASILPVQIIGAGYAINVLISISLAVQQARGHFRAWGLSLLALAIGTMGAAYLGAMAGQSALDREIFVAHASPLHWDGVAERVWLSGVYIAISTAAFGVISSLAHVVIALKPLGVGRREIVFNTIRVWVLGLAAGAVTITLDNVVDAPVRDFISGLFHSPRAARFIGESSLFIVSGLLFSALYAGMVRLFFADALVEGIQMIPARFRARLTALFALPSDPGAIPAP